MTKQTEEFYIFKLKSIETENKQINQRVKLLNQVHSLSLHNTNKQTSGALPTT